MKKIILGIFIFLTVASFAHAQEAYTQNGTPISPTQGVIQQTQGNTDISYTPLEPLPGLAQYETGNANFGQLLSMVFKLLIILAALIAVGSFVYAGISYMVSDVPLVKFDASKRLQAAFLGLAILLGSWIILFTINPQLVSFNGALNPVTVFQQSSINQNQNQQGVRITTEVNGTTIAPTIVASDNNAAISQVQTSGTSVDPAVLKQAADDIQASRAGCASVGGIIVPGVTAPGSGCGGESVFQHRDSATGKNTTYQSCANIQLIRGYEACLYNPQQ